MNNPKVSVVMSVYNGERYLRESIDSILNQSFTDFEVIIIDDTSNDSTPELLKDYAKKDSRIKIIRNEENLGLTKSLNKAIRVSKGEYIARMDADDISYPKRFEAQVQFLDNNKNCAVAGTWARIIDGEGKELRIVKYPTGSQELKKTLIKYTPFFHSSVVIRKSAVDEVGGYDENWKFAQDYELWLRLAQKFELANIGEVLIDYRESSGTITSKKNREQIGFVIKAKKLAIGRGQYSAWNYSYLLKSYLSMILPVGLKRFIKNI